LLNSDLQELSRANQQLSKNRTLRSRLALPVKIIVAASLIFFLIRSGKLDLNQLSVFVKNPSVLYLTALSWLFLGVLVGSSRWFLLLKGIGLMPQYLRTVHLSVVGLFFNTVMPGAVGGDLIKGIYLFRDQKEGTKAAAILTVFLDRILGLYGLFTVASIGIFLQADLIFSHKALIAPSLFAIGFFVAMTLFFILVLYPVPFIEPAVDKLLIKKFIGSEFLNKTYQALKKYRTQRKFLYLSWFFSMLLQGGIITFYWYLTPIMTGTEVSFGLIASVIPIGFLLIAMPLAPGGLGVGHLAFDRLFSMISVEGGANIFNVIFIGQTAMNLCGFIPYLLFKSNVDSQAVQTEVK